MTSKWLQRSQTNQASRRRTQRRSTKAQDDRSYRQIEDYYKRRGYPKENIEGLAEGDFQLVQRLKKRTRKPLNLDLLKGIEN